MALPPLPEHNTPRFFLDYEGSYGKRTVQFRSRMAGGLVSVVTALNDFVDLARSLQYADTLWTGLRIAEEGSNVSNPLPWVVKQGMVAGGLSAEFYPRFIAFWGRGTDGRETKATLFGTMLPVTSDYRISGAENGTVQDIIDFLNSSAGGFCTISGSDPIWKQYANSGYNAYHQRKRRIVG